MNSELTLRVIFITLYILFFFMRGYYARKVHRSLQTSLRERWREAVKHEGKLSIGLRAPLFPTYIAAIVLYAIYPHWMTQLTLPFPTWLRWIGVCLGIFSFPLSIWAHHTLGEYWSTSLELREQHTLITNGPYRWVRHPMYTALFAFMIALVLVSANWLIALPNMAAIIIIYVRIGKEEAMMIDRFSDEYRDYMKCTGRLLPRLIH